MKTSALLVIACTLFALHSHSQITVGNVKGKMADKVKSTVKPSPKPEEKPKTQYAIDQENMKNSPAYKAIYTFRFHAPSALDEIKNGRYFKVDSAFLAGTLNEIRELDPTWVDMEKDQATFDTIVKKCSPYWMEQRYYPRFDRIRSTSQSLLDYRHSLEYNNLKEYQEEIGKVKYEALKNAYLQEKNQSNSSLKCIREIDTFYTIYPKRIKDRILEKNAEKMKDMGSSTKDIRSQPDFIDKVAAYKISYVNPEKMTKVINEYQADLQKALLFMPDDKELTDIINKLDAIKVDYAEYASSGEYERNIPLVSHKRLDNVRCPKPLNTNATLVAAVKKSFANSAEKVLRVSITETDWRVHKNGYGTLTDRAMETFVVYTTADGKCYLERGEVYCTYLNGNWSSAKFHFLGDPRIEMLSQNAQK